MDIDVIIYFVLGTITLAAFSFFVTRWHYLQTIKEKDNSIVDLQQMNQEMSTSLNSASIELRQLEDKCNKGETALALREQKIETQATSLEDIKTEKTQLISKLEASNQLVKILTADKAELESSKKEKSDQADEYKNNAKILSEKLEQSNEKNASLEANIREQRATLKAEEDKLAELKEQFEKQKLALKNEFKVVSEEIIKERQKVLNEQNKEGVSALLKPLQQQIMGFQQRVNEVHTETIKGNTNLEAEIKKVMEVGIKMRDDASNLTSALKGNSQQRGAWGEAQLERTLEMSGLTEDTHFAKQSSFKDQAGKQKQTDYLIKLPDNKHIIIDSKVSLVDYDRAISSETDAEQTTAINEHVKSVKKHIDDLASKDYTNLIGMHSPSFVLMFMPIEPAYIEALKHSKELFGYGYDKNIVLVSHTTLIPILRTVANLWMLDQSNNEAREISEKAGDIYNSVCTVAERFQKLGNTLNTASTQYNQVVTAISGKQGLQGKVERFTQLSSKVSKKMPELENRHFEYETAQLEIQPIAIEDDSIEVTSE